jgi:site-specific DNA-cytosine methylase
MKHAGIIPLVGGAVIGATQSLKRNPEYIVSWKAFAKNDYYCGEYFPTVPWYNVDDDKKIPKLPKVDLITCVPPCSGLSNATTGTRGCQAPQNQHMLNVAEYGMATKTACILIENAPTLYSQGGYEFFVKFVPLAQKYGYSIQLYKTSTILHGLPQNRVRCFVMLWKGKQQPVLNWIKEPYIPMYDWPIEKGEVVHEGKASEDECVATVLDTFGGYKELYRYIMQEGGGPRTSFNLIRQFTPGWQKIKWKEHRYKTLFERVQRKSVLDVTPTFVRDHTNALMWKVTTYMVHPTKNRFVNTRELMSWMGLPDDYPTIPKKDMNKIFQNVPVNTVKTLVDEISAALDGRRLWVKVPFMRVNNIKQQVESKAYTLDSLKYE